MIEPDEFEAVARFIKLQFPGMEKPRQPLAMQGSDWLDALFAYVDDETRNRLMAFAKHFGFIYRIDESNAPAST